MIHQILYANAVSLKTTSSYNFTQDIQVAAPIISEANLYNMDFLNVNYNATNYHIPSREGQTTVVGYSVRVLAVTKYREAMIKVV